MDLPALFAPDTVFELANALALPGRVSLTFLFGPAGLLAFAALRALRRPIPATASTGV